MGRRRGFLATMIREAEKANRRAVAEARREQRQLNAAYMRAVEREMARSERELERQQAREARETERRRVDQERQRMAQDKQAAKEAQLRAWALELETHQERESEIAQIGNEAPEVEDRDRMYEALEMRRPFEPEPFIAPPPHRSFGEANAIQAHVTSETQAAIGQFRPDLRAYRQFQFAGGGIFLLGLGLMKLVSIGVGFLTLAIGATIMAIAGSMASSSAKTQRRQHAKTTGERLATWAREQTAALARHDAALTEQATERAKADHAMRAQYGLQQFDQLETERLRAVAGLLAGAPQHMQTALPAYVCARSPS